MWNIKPQEQRLSCYFSRKFSTSVLLYLTDCYNAESVHYRTSVSWNSNGTSRLFGVILRCFLFWWVSNFIWVWCCDCFLWCVLNLDFAENLLFNDICWILDHWGKLVLHDKFTGASGLMALIFRSLNLKFNDKACTFVKVVVFYITNRLAVGLLEKFRTYFI